MNCPANDCQVVGLPNEDREMNPLERDMWIEFFRKALTLQQTARERQNLQVLELAQPLNCEVTAKTQEDPLPESMPRKHRKCEGIQNKRKINGKTRKCATNV
jgi:hypothetical protein